MRATLKKYLAIILALVMIISALPMVNIAFAETSVDAGYGYAQTLGMTIGENIYDHDFATAGVPAGWEGYTDGDTTYDTKTGTITRDGNVLNSIRFSLTPTNGTYGQQIKMTADNFVIKATFYVDTSKGCTGYAYISLIGKNKNESNYRILSQMRIGGHEVGGTDVKANEARIMQGTADGTNVVWSSSDPRIENFGFGTDGLSPVTVYIYRTNSTTYYVDKNGTYLGEVKDPVTTDEVYFRPQGSWLVPHLTDFEVYELLPPPDGYSYAKTLGMELGKNVYDHDFSVLSSLPEAWETVDGYTRTLATVKVGEETKNGLRIYEQYGSKFQARIKLPADNYVLKATFYMNNDSGKPRDGSLDITKKGKNSDDTSLTAVSSFRIGGPMVGSTGNPTANQGLILRYNTDGTANWSDVTKIDNFGFGADGLSGVTLYIYTINGVNYYVDNSGNLLGKANEAKILEETYFIPFANWLDTRLTDFEVYELSPLPDGYSYAETLGVEIGNNIYDHNFATAGVPAGWEGYTDGDTTYGTKTGTITRDGNVLNSIRFSLTPTNGTYGQQIKMTADNFVIKATFYVDTSKGGTGYAYISLIGKNKNESNYRILSQMRIGGHEAGGSDVKANEARIMQGTADGTNVVWSSSDPRIENFGFGTDGLSPVTVYIYRTNSTTYYVDKNGTYLGEVKDPVTTDEVYFRPQGSWLVPHLTDFEVYELNTVSNIPTISGGTASILTPEAFENTGIQAMRVYYYYTLNANGKIEFMNSEYELSERGVLITASSESEILTLETMDSKVHRTSKTDAFDKCWAQKSNSDGTTTVVFSTYLTGFSNEMYDLPLYFRGYLVLKDGDQEKIVYTEEISANSISSVSSSQ